MSRPLRDRLCGFTLPPLLPSQDDRDVRYAVLYWIAAAALFPDADADFDGLFTPPNVRLARKVRAGLEAQGTAPETAMDMLDQMRSPGGAS